MSVIETSTSVSLLLSRSSGFPGSVSLSGKLFKGTTAAIIPYKTIDLLVNGAKVKSATTNSSGLYNFSYTVASGYYTFQTRFNGDGLYTASWSPVRTGTYGKVGTSWYGLNINPLAGGGPLAVTIVAQLRRDDQGTGLNSKSVKLYRNKNGGSFTAIQTKNTVSTSGGPGFALFNDTLTTIGEYGYYLFFAGDSQFEGCEVSDGSIVLEGNGEEPPNGDGVAGGVGILLLALLVLSQE